VCSALSAANRFLYPDGCRMHFQGSGIAVVIPPACIDVLRKVVIYNRWTAPHLGRPAIELPKVIVTLYGSGGQVLASVADANAWAAAHSAYQAFSQSPDYAVEAYVHAQYFAYDGPGVLTSGWTSASGAALPTTILYQSTPASSPRLRTRPPSTSRTDSTRRPPTLTRLTHDTGPVIPI
jgi:hypothetical protein